MASIKQRENGRWQARVSYYDKAGKRHNKAKTFRTKKEAVLFGQQFEIDASTDSLTKGGTKLFVDYFWEWFETYKESSVRDRTRLTYAQAHKVLEKYIPDVVLEDMDRRTYQQFIRDYGQNHAKSTVSKMNSLYHAAVKDGLYDGFIKKDFVRGVSLVYDRERTWKIEYLNVDETTRLIKYLYDNRNPHHLSKYMIITALLTGMRPGEIGGLKWDDINFNFKTFNLRQSWIEEKNDFGPLKNESSYRIIRVDDFLLDLLKELPRDDERGRVFVNQSYGTVPSSSGVNKVLRYAFKELGISRSGFHFHSCRHTHVAYLLSKGIDLYAISKRLGHSDITVTSRTYSYLIDEYKTRTDDLIVDAISDLITSEEDAATGTNGN